MTVRLLSKPRLLLLLASFAILGIAFVSSPATSDGSFASGLPSPHVAGEVLVKFRPGADVAGIVRSQNAQVTGQIAGINVTKLKVPENTESAVVNALSHDPNVDYAELDYVATVTDTIPNDPYFTTSALPGSSPPQWGPQKVQAPAAWDLTTGSPSVIVAVLDTGVQASHPDLAGKVLSGYNFVSNNADTSDNYGSDGHGTGVAGVIAADTNNGIGIAGISWQSPILPVKVCSDTGFCDLSNAASGVVYATDHGANVINMSFASYSISTTLNDAIQYAWTKGVVIVAAAGNGGAEGAPANDSNVVAVGCSDENDAICTYSSYGPTMSVVAPGELIYTLSTSWSVPNNPSGRYYYWGSGTSMSSPHVAGAAALLWATGASSNTAVVDAINRGADDLLTPGWDQFSGWGRLNIYRSLLTLTGVSSPTPTPTHSPTPTPTHSPTPTPTHSPTPTPTHSPTQTPSPTPTSTPSPTPTPMPICPKGIVPSWPVPSGDTDCDGFTTTVENFVGTNPKRACGVNTWPPDFNNDSMVTLSDVVSFIQHFSTTQADPNYAPRFDLNADGRIGLADVVALVPFFGKSCLQ